MNTNELNTKDSFVFYRSMLESADLYEGDDKIEFLEAIIRYGLDGTEPTFKKKYIQATWVSIKPNLINAHKRRESQIANGNKGGRPSKKRTESEIKDAEAVKSALAALKVETPAVENITPPQASNGVNDSNLVKYIKSKELGKEDEERFLYLVDDGHLKTIADINAELMHIFK